MTPHRRVKVARYQARDVLRSRGCIAYVAFFALVTDALLRFRGRRRRRAAQPRQRRAVRRPARRRSCSATTYVYNAREFTELLLAQPIGRRRCSPGCFSGSRCRSRPASRLASRCRSRSTASATAPSADARHARRVRRGAHVRIRRARVLVATRSDDKVRGLGIAVALWLRRPAVRRPRARRRGAVRRLPGGAPAARR